MDEWGNRTDLFQKWTNRSQQLTNITSASDNQASVAITSFVRKVSRFQHTKLYHSDWTYIIVGQISNTNFKTIWLILNLILLFEKTKWWIQNEELKKYIRNRVTALLNIFYLSCFCIYPLPIAVVNLKPKSDCNQFYIWRRISFLV